jgi:uncharacterized protein YukE
MQETIDVKVTLTEAAEHQKAALEKLVAFAALSEELAASIGSGGWQGKAQENCSHLNEAVGQYAKSLQEIVQGFLNHIEQLARDADRFDETSENVALADSL